MFEALYGGELILTQVMTVIWLLAAWLTGRLCRQGAGGRPNRLLAVLALFLTGLAMVLLAGKGVIAALLWKELGWRFAMTTVAGFFPLILPAAAGTLCLSVPWLWQAVRGREVQRFSAPAVVLPLQAGALASLSGVLLVFNQMVPPAWDEVLRNFALYLAGVVLLHLRNLRRYRTLSGAMKDQPRHLGARLGRSVLTLLVFAAGIGIWVYGSAAASRLPDRMPMMDHGHHAGHGDGTADTVSVTQLAGPHHERPDRRFVLTAQKSRIQLPSGAVVDGYTFNGQAPGPELRMRQGELIEVTLINRDVSEGVTVHWHGLNVPNAEDGVAGVTQDAVLPGESYTYRFRVEQAGTYWYHSHQQSSVQVKKGLFGPLIVEPREGMPEETLEKTLVFHQWETEQGKPVPALGLHDALQREKIAPGTQVRLRLINADNWTRRFWMAGVPFRVVAIDGNPIHQPDTLDNARLILGGGGRYDLEFTMPDHPVKMTVMGEAKARSRQVAVVYSPDGTGDVTASSEAAMDFHPESYGRPAPVPFGPDSKFDREYTLMLDGRPGFYDGSFTYLWTINGESFPNVPTLMVKEGELVKTTFVNRGFMDHPMHLHGHHMLVLSRNGKPVTGSPWWTDTLNVAPGETYEVAFRADNPGIWMDHCHNLEHAAVGMTLHLAYEGVTTPFEVGRATRNQPE